MKKKVDIKKLVLLNFPYLFAFYFGNKVFAVFRQTPGTLLIDKLSGGFANFGNTFSNPLPSVYPFDLLVGFAVALLLKFAVYMKAQNRKKYRQGVEYGSARWGKAEDIQPYMDPKFENNVILTQTESLTMNSRPKQPKYARNKNILVIGGSGSGKTRFFVKPNLMQCHTAGKATASTARSFQEKASEKVEEFVAKHKKAFLWVGVGAAVIVFIAAGFSSCTAMFSTMGSSVVSTSYLSEDDAMLGAEAQYCQLEDELRDYLNNYEATHDYDEYHFDLDDIEHDPYVLVSALSALHGGEFTLAGVQGTIQMLFDKQYILTENVVHEVRYRTETRTGTTTSTDPETGETTTETYEYEVQVPYDYYICYVTLENFNLSHVPVYIMGEDELALYSAYMATLGNREDLFPGSGYVDKYINNPPSDYTVPAEYLNDEKFATLLTEAEKYLGYPYVWGGSNPSTSFDCSGFVSYVLTNSGLVNTGRLGAQGLCNVCTPVSRDNARPGDLVFFKGTYDTPGVSHVGIYVGNGVMLHCGDPIQYTSINTSYWQEHFYTFGRPAY